MSELAALQKQVEELTARVVAIEHGLTLGNAELRRAGFTGSEATLLGLILRREIVSRNAAMLALYGSAVDEIPDPRIVDAFMNRIREKLRAKGLPTPVTRQGAGFFLTEGAKHHIRRDLGLPGAAA
jgi:two-component system cell cycle response regulator CtrA